MISLDSSEWHRLKHAYGAASNIPQLLRHLADNPSPTKNYRDEPWFSLWSALCHQGSVYDASFAAVPHIVEVGIAASGPIDFGFFQLPASIELGRHRQPTLDLPPHLKTPYLAALHRLHEGAFKQEDGVIYNARDMAIVRAQITQCPIVLASATPSLETVINVRSHRFNRVHLPQRYNAAGAAQGWTRSSGRSRWSGWVPASCS